MESGWRSQCFLGRSVKTPVQLRQFQEGGGDFLAKSAFAAEFGNFRHFGVDNFFRKKGRTLSINSAPISFRGFATRCPSPAQMTTKSWPDTQPGKVDFAWKWGHGGTTPESEGGAINSDMAKSEKPYSISAMIIDFRRKSLLHPWTLGSERNVFRAVSLKQQCSRGDAKGAEVISGRNLRSGPIFIFFWISPLYRG